MAAEPGVLAARLALRWLGLGEWRAHPARFALTALAIAVGVALGFAVHLVNGSALASFDRAVQGVNGAADLSIKAATPLGFDERLYARVATAAGVSDASPVVQLDARAGGHRFALLGLDAIRAVRVTPGLVGSATTSNGEAQLDERALFLSSSALRATGAHVGQEIAVIANGHAVPLRVAGTLPGAGEGQAIGVLDIATAQWRFGRLGRLDRLDLKLADRDAAEPALRRILPADATLASAATAARQGDALSRAYRVNLDMLALVALLTGGFLVFSAQSLSVARRLRTFALVRTLGLPQSGVVAAVAIEGIAIGLVGALAGLGIGYGIAALALRWFGGDLGAGYFAGGAAHVRFLPGAAAAFFLLGVAAAVLGSVLPARAAARAAPAATLKSVGDLADPRVPVPWVPALLLMLLGGGSALLPAVGGLPLFGFGSMALLLGGGIAGVPWLARRLLAAGARRPISRVPVLLAVRHVHGAPGEAATALCGIVASTALMIAMATMVASFRTAVDDWLGQVLAADLYLRVEGGGFDPATQARMRGQPGIRRVTFSRQLALTLAPDRPPLTLIARPIGNGADPLLTPLGRTASPPKGVPVAWVSEPAARLYRWRVGDRITLPVGGATRFAVAGIWRDYARQAGAVVIDAVDYTRLTGDALRDEAIIDVAPGGNVGEVGHALLARLPSTLRSQVDVALAGALRRYALTLFDRSFAITYVLEAVAILVGLAGVAATISAQTVARAREFGMLRHLGVERAQITGMLATEGAILGVVGGIAGVLLGLAMSQVLIHVINPQSFNWTMATRVPWRTVVGVIAALAAAAAGTAVLAGRRATARDAVLAVREDW